MTGDHRRQGSGLTVSSDSKQNNSGVRQRLKTQCCWSATRECTVHNVRAACVAGTPLLLACLPACLCVWGLTPA